MGIACYIKTACPHLTVTFLQGYIMTSEKQSHIQISYRLDHIPYLESALIHIHTACNIWTGQGSLQLHLAICRAYRPINVFGQSRQQAQICIGQGNIHIKLISCIRHFLCKSRQRHPALSCQGIALIGIYLGGSQVLYLHNIVCHLQISFYLIYQGAFYLQILDGQRNLRPWGCIRTSNINSGIQSTTYVILNPSSLSQGTNINIVGYSLNIDVPIHINDTFGAKVASFSLLTAEIFNINPSLVQRGLQYYIIHSIAA